MDAISYTEALTNFSNAMTRVCDSREPLIIRRRNAESVVMLSLKDYSALQETTYLFNTRENASCLLASITELEGEPSQNPSSTTDLAK